MNISSTSITSPSCLVIELRLIRDHLIITYGTWHRVDEILDGLSSSQVVCDDQVVNHLLHGSSSAVHDLSKFESTDLLGHLTFKLSQKASIDLEDSVDPL